MFESFLRIFDENKPTKPKGTSTTRCSNAAGGRLPSLDSDCLDLCLFAWTDRQRFIRSFRASRNGSHLALPGVTYLQARRATVSASGIVWVQTDGELLGELPMTFACVPAALSIIVPEA